MRFSFDFKKQVFVQTIIVLFIGLTLGFVFGQAVITPRSVNQSIPWHVLQQISNGLNAQQVSVDSNNNGIIDNAENANFAITANNSVLLNGKSESQLTKFNCTKVFDGYDTTSQYYQGNNAYIAKVSVPSQCLDRECKIIVLDVNSNTTIRVADYYQTPSGIGSIAVGLTGGINLWSIQSYTGGGSSSMDNSDWGTNGDSVGQSLVNLPNLGAADSWLFDDYSGNTNGASFNEVASYLWTVKNKASQGTQIFVCG